MLQVRHLGRRLRNSHLKKLEKVDKTCFVADKTYSYYKKAAVTAVKLQTELADSFGDGLSLETCFVNLKLGMYSVSALASGKGKRWAGGKSVLYLRITMALIALARKAVFQTEVELFGILMIQLKPLADAQNLSFRYAGQESREYQKDLLVQKPVASLVQSQMHLLAFLQIRSSLLKLENASKT